MGGYVARPSGTFLAPQIETDRMETAMNRITSSKIPGRDSSAMVARFVMLALSGSLVAALGSVPAAAQRQNDDSNAVRDCINLMQIDHTRVVDEDTILFYMRGDDVYRNDLPNRCPGLDFDERFMYRVTLNQLCDVDVITVIDDLGFGFMAGASCGLGKFRPISEEEAEALTGRRRDRVRD
jgi:hypothetical protein